MGLERTLMLGKMEGRRRNGRQRMRWLDGITDSMDMVWVDSRSWWWTGRPVCYGSWGHKESDTTEQLNWSELFILPKSSLMSLNPSRSYVFVSSCVEKIDAVAWRLTVSLLFAPTPARLRLSLRSARVGCVGSVCVFCHTAACAFCFHAFTSSPDLHFSSLSLVS